MGHNHIFSRQKSQTFEKKLSFCTLKMVLKAVSTLICLLGAGKFYQLVLLKLFFFVCFFHLLLNIILPNLLFCVWFCCSCQWPWKGRKPKHNQAWLCSTHVWRWNKTVFTRSYQCGPTMCNWKYVSGCFFISLFFYSVRFILYKKKH